MTPPAQVTTLDDVVLNVRALLAAVGDLRDAVLNPGGVEFLIGEKHLAKKGAPPRIVCVLTEDDGSISGPLAVGARQVGSFMESVRCYVWGAETADDATRYVDAKARAFRLMNAFRASAPGRLAGGNLTRSTATHELTHGEEYTLSYVYACGVPEDPAIWTAAYAIAQSPPNAPPNPDQPNGNTGADFGLGAVTLTNTRP